MAPVCAVCGDETAGVERMIHVDPVGVRFVHARCVGFYGASGEVLR